MITVYGIRSCDTVRKARAWLDAQGLEYRLHDYKKEGVPAERLGDWIERFGWETVINRRGTTWRRLPAAEREAMDVERATEAARTNPSLIKRPVVEHDGGTLVGFDMEKWQEVLR
ncbi:arsenate reductase [Guyparkeria sp. 1SP6A2]|nr:arsenate reductase [Guyparkeria sp. 1SP6A2]